MLSLQEAQVQSLVREVRSCMLCSAIKRKKKEREREKEREKVPEEPYG